MERLRVEAVAVAAGDRGHAWAEAADDDRRRRIGPKKSGLAAPELPDERDGVDHALRAHGVGVDGLANRRLLRRVRRAATAAGAEPQEQSSAGDALQRRRHVRENAGRLLLGLGAGGSRRTPYAAEQA